MKTLVFTDIHFGINSDKPSRQKIAADVISEITDVCLSERIERIYFLGDLFHHRSSIEVSTLHVADECISDLARDVELVMLQGNHDQYERSGTSISSMGFLRRKGVRVVSRPEETELNGQKLLLVPWCGDVRDVTIRGFCKDAEVGRLGGGYDILMGHVNVSSAQEIERAYGRLKNGALKNEGGIGGILDVRSPEYGDTQAEELFSLTKPGSQLFLGHIHDHSELVLAKRLFHIVGSPQMQTHDLQGGGEAKAEHGYYILDDENNAVFSRVKSAPEFVTVYASEIRAGAVNPDRLRGSIVKRCYDCSLTPEEARKFDDIVSSAGVLEEDTAVFSESASAGASAAGIAEKTNSIVSASREEYLKIEAERTVRESMPGADEAAVQAALNALLDRLMGYYRACC